ncbi:MAG: extensin family protein [Pararhodobacter sp.]|nr:extensin family protein [Pararhodobacter sp.]
MAGLLIAAFVVPAALAHAPGRSPFPEPRPGPAAAAQMQPPPARSVDQALAEAMPSPPPARAVQQALAQALPEASAALSIAPARSPRPEPRRAAALRRAAPSVVVLPARAGGGVAPSGSGARAGGSAGGICGRATLAGQRVAPINSSTRGCGIAEPVRLTAVDGIALSRMATLDCDAARALDRWVREQMRPAIGNRGGGVVQIDVAAHYVCRTRNHRAGARISEHGRGRAIDISGFRLANGEQVTVLRDFRRGPHARALQRMYRGACGVFTTTLGPGSDRFHEDHFHFDVAQRRGGATFCR